jgi:Flp pilus assembly protein TadD
VLLGYTYAAQGRFSDAIAAYQEAIKRGRSTPSTQIFLGAAYARAGDRERARAILKKLQTGEEYVSPGELAVLHAALDDKGQAFASLERAYEAHDPQLQYIGVSPAFDSLRSDSRFTDLVRRVGLSR